jgi:dTDP-4-dehydrorhamnose 3,5-epimerase
MGMQFERGNIDGLVICRPCRFRDERGFFEELYQARRYREEGGIDAVFVQDNRSCSQRGTLRGLHYQRRHAQAKLVTCLRGVVFSVAVDLRRGSPSFGHWQGVRLEADAGTQFFIPAGFAHGFCVLSEEAEFFYKCSDLYVPAEERGLAWNDPALKIAWPLAAPLLSEKDRRHPRLSELPDADLPEPA